MSASDRPQLGYIGLGLMGKPMARNLLKAGYSVTVFNRSRPSMEELDKEGASLADSSREVAERSEIIFMCVPDSEDVIKVVTGPDGILEGLKPGSVVVDMSTISAIVSQDIAKTVAEKGSEFLDAPVSGGDKGAIEGILSIMVGGAEEAFNRCLPMFEVMGKTITHMGPSGCGSVTKLANQIVAAVTWQGIAEGMSLGAKAGIDPAKLHQALSAGAARCWALEVRVPLVLEGDFKPGFKAKHQFKDMGHALSAGRSFGVPLHAASLVHDLFKILTEKGGGEMDVSALVTVQEEMAATEIRAKK